MRGSRQTERIRSCGEGCESRLLQRSTSARENDFAPGGEGGGHSYQGTSNRGPDPLLVWTRHINDVSIQEAFVPQGCGGKQAPRRGGGVRFRRNLECRRTTP